MLILSRGIGQSVNIGDDIKVTVIGVKKGKWVQIAVKAPQHISIFREEIYERIQREKELRLLLCKE